MIDGLSSNDVGFQRPRENSAELGQKMLSAERVSALNHASCFCHLADARAGFIYPTSSGAGLNARASSLSRWTVDWIKHQ